MERSQSSSPLHSEEEAHSANGRSLNSVNLPTRNRQDLSVPREVIYISSDEEDEPPPRRPLTTPKSKHFPISPAEEILELTDSEDERDLPEIVTGKLLESVALPALLNTSSLTLNNGSDSESDQQDHATLVYPGSARKAVRLDIRKEVPDTPGNGAKAKPRPKLPQDDNPPLTPKRAPTSTLPKTPRTGKKAKEAAERERLMNYSKEWFHRLNHEVFDMKLPEETEIIWNAKLISCAGRAHFKRTRDQQGNATYLCKVDMATKIVNSEERIRNTLSHELCHLACWVIDGKLDEGHGRLWKSWIHRVMKKLPHVEITSKHSYDMNYPFTWECLKCGKIYGRWSKSIKVEQHGCGEPGCKGARLKALFETRSRAPKAPDTPAGSKQTSKMSRAESSRLYLEDEDDEQAELEVEMLATKLASTEIASLYDDSDPFQ